MAPDCPQPSDPGRAGISGPPVPWDVKSREAGLKENSCFPTNLKQRVGTGTYLAETCSQAGEPT